MTSFFKTFLIRHQMKPSILHFKNQLANCQNYEQIFYVNSVHFSDITKIRKICYDMFVRNHKICDGGDFMGIVQSAKLAERRINNNLELLQKEIETLTIIYEHNAISEAEYHKSVRILQQNLHQTAS